ncbi:MAG: PKD domain-containing protein, partial [Planctomycetota bacterium]
MEAAVSDQAQHRWSFETVSGGVTPDAVGSLDAVLVDGASLAAGSSGQALSTDGIDDHARIDGLTYAASFSIAFWFRADDLSGDGYQYLYSHGAFGVAESVNIYFVETECSTSTSYGELRTYLRDADDRQESWALDVGPGYGDGQWHHYCLVVDAAGGEATSQVFIDGQLRAWSTLGGGAFAPGDPCVLGGRENLTSTRFFPGALDEVLIFDSALDWSAVQDLGGAEDDLVVDLQAPISGSWSDASGNGNDAQLYNGPAIDGEAVTFDGLDDHGQIAAPLAYGPAFTLSFFFQVSDNSGTAYQYLVDHGVADTTGNVMVYFVEDSCATSTNVGALRTWIMDADDISQSWALDVDTPLADGLWHHYALVVTPDGGSDAARVYIDGQLAASGDFGGDLFVPSGSLYLGTRGDLDPDRFLQGSMRSVRLHNRSLDQTELQSLAGTGTGLLADFTAVSGGDYLDTSGNEHSGELHGGTADDGGGTLLLDGVDDHVTVDSLRYGPSFSLGFNFQVDDNSGDGYQYLLSHGLTGYRNSLAVYFVRDDNSSSISDGELRTWFKDGDDDTDSWSLDTTAGLADGAWHHYMVVVDGSAQTTTVYIDGQSVANTSAGGGTFLPHTALHLGARYSLDAEDFFDGSLRDLQVYGSALGASAVAQTAADLTPRMVSVDGSSSLHRTGEVVTISAAPPPTGQVFAGWTGDTQHLADPAAAVTSVTVPAADVTFEATYQDANQPPLADAGPDQSVAIGDLVTLDGSGSSDPDGDLLSYDWVQTAGPSVSLDDTSLAQPRFTAADAGSYTFELTVSDGTASASDQVQVSVDADYNAPPVAEAGPSRTVSLGSQVLLDGSSSLDPDGLPGPISFAWEQVSGPSVVLTGAQQAQAEFNAGSAGVLLFELTVSDGLAQDVDRIQVVVTSSNLAPEADAGADQTLASGADILLDGSGSLDPDAGPVGLTVQWDQITGPAVQITNDTALQASVAAPPDGSYLFRLTVDDGERRHTDQVRVDVGALSGPGFYELQVIGGSGSGLYPLGTSVAVEAHPAPEPLVFHHWDQRWETHDPSKYEAKRNVRISDIGSPLIMEAVHGQRPTLTFIEGGSSGTESLGGEVVV